MKLTKAQSLISALVLLTFYSTSYAERICVHGHSGAVEDPKAKFTKYGWGLRIYPIDMWSEGFDNWGVGNWIHYSIPVDSKKLGSKGEEVQKTYSKIRVRVNSVPYTFIDKIHVYDGEKRFKIVDSLHPWNSGTNYIEITLDSPATLWNSIGVSLRAATYKEDASREYLEIYSVCAFE